MDTQQVTDVLDASVERAHDLIFAVNKPITESYFTLFTLDNGERRIARFEYASETNPQGVTEHMAQVFTCLGKAKMLSFAMLSCLENPALGVFEYWCFATDNSLTARAAVFTPFVNDDGASDYMMLEARPERKQDQEALEQMVVATTHVWLQAMELGKADLEVSEQRLADLLDLQKETQENVSFEPEQAAP